jgi:hypothetical protein
MLGLAASLFLELYALIRFLQPEYFLFSRLARNLNFRSEPREFLTCVLQSLLFRAQSGFFSAMVSLSFRTQTSGVLERAFMFFRSLLLVGCLTLQFLNALSFLLDMEAGFTFKAQAFLLNQPSGRFFSPYPFLYFLEPSCFFLGCGPRSVDLCATAREALLNPRQRFFIRFQTKALLFSATAGFLAGSSSRFFDQLSLRGGSTISLFQTLPFFLSAQAFRSFVDKVFQ